MLAAWPAGAMYHQARLVLGRIDLPQLFDADTVMLRGDAGGKVVSSDQLLACLLYTSRCV